MRRAVPYDRTAWREGVNPGLLTDMYHPDAAYISWCSGHNGIATFDLYTRHSPLGGAYLLVAGLEQALEFVRDFHYTQEDLRFLAQVRGYDPRFLEELGELHFTGEILAMPEGSIAFPDEPLLRVTAPFREALLIEAGLLNAVNLATLIATKASRIVWAAKGRRVSEFSFRRAQEPFVVARSAFIGGCSSTSFLAAAYQYRLLATGTIPHALVQIFDEERSAFEAVAKTYNRYTLLLDTYDVQRAVHTAVDVANEYQNLLGHTLAAVRLDSGDLLEDSRYVREVLDEAGLTDVKILASGDLDEFSIADLLARGAPVDAFGVGTSLGVGAGSVAHEVDGGSLGGVYKLVQYAGAGQGARPLIKHAMGKVTWPGKKEVYRIGQFEEDLVMLASERPPERSARLLRPVVQNGAVLPGSLPPLSEVWELAQHNLRSLPEQYRVLKDAPRYPVRFSTVLTRLREELLSGGVSPFPDSEVTTDHAAPGAS
ncbi:MAG: nicotinate phosphoribosyltransferase [Chloroflexi bacterium]|nr:nicotinate phosphoribosyltransferase [Chloroflexota bacterium]